VLSVFAGALALHTGDMQQGAAERAGRREQPAAEASAVGAALETSSKEKEGNR